MNYAVAIAFVLLTAGAGALTWYDVGADRALKTYGPSLRTGSAAAHYRYGK
jgi:hypothetical protein